MRFGDWIGNAPVIDDSSAKLQKAGRNRVVVSHAVGAADDGPTRRTGLLDRPHPSAAIPQRALMR